MDTTPVDLVRKDLESVEARLREFPLPAEALVIDSLERLLAAGGKRLRPALSLLFGRMLEAPEDPLLKLSASLELVHTATLIHDDLVDRAPLRRGVPALHAEMPAGTAVLAGDFLFAWAARLAAATGSLPVVQKFACALGSIVDGEIRQIAAGGADCTLAEYERRIGSKTAALFEVSCMGPALLAEKSAAAEPAAEYGRSFGMAFQIADDIQDFTADAARTGKPAGQDLRQGLLTLPAILYFGDHPGDPDVTAFLSKAPEPGAISRLLEKIRLSEAIESSRRHARRHIDGAVKALTAFPVGAHRNALEILVASIV
ncbi:MAG: polyprenyl synthetase family protein [Anaerolineales bacterium]|nr:polyprenyl synthetase family protein [Anaerolineales bacterium]